MATQYSLWRVTFSYESPGEHAGARAREVYTVVARDGDEARSKSSATFIDTPAYASAAMIRTTVNRIIKRKLTLPELSLAEDRDHFAVVPRLSRDNSSIEYLVTERKGK